MINSVLEARGKRVDTGEWIRGFILEYHESCFISDGNYDEDTGIHLGSEEGTTYWFGRFHQVAHDSIGISSGHIDKAGIEVFSGDILVKEEGHGINYYLVRYDDANTKFVAECRITFSGNTQNVVMRVFPPEFKSCKVCGNRFDNPDLLKLTNFD